MTTMNLSQLVNYLSSEMNMPNNAEYLRTAYEEITEVDGIKMIDADFVKRHMTISLEDNQAWRQIQANVTSYMWLERVN